MRLLAILVMVLAACGDDGGSAGVDSSMMGSDAAGSGSDAGGGLVGGMTLTTPTDIMVGQTGMGSLAMWTQTPAPGGPDHYWRFTPPQSLAYRITLTGSDGMDVVWCGNNASVGGCLCDRTGAPPYSCCSVHTGAPCVAQTGAAVMSDDGIIVVTNFGTASGSYTITLAAP